MLALIVALTFAFIGLAIVMIVIWGAALVGTFVFLGKHPHVRAVVAPASVVILLVAGAWWWARNAASRNWIEVAKKLAPMAQQADPLRENLSPFSHYAPYAQGYQTYADLTPAKRNDAAYEVIDGLAGVSDRRHRGYAPGSNHYNIGLANVQCDAEKRHRLDYDTTLIAVQGAALNAVLKLAEAPNASTEAFSRSGDLEQAGLFLARRTLEGYPDASRDLALLYSKLSPEPVNLYLPSYCRQRIQDDFGIVDADCDRYDPLKGHGLAAVLYRKWLGFARQ